MAKKKHGARRTSQTKQTVSIPKMSAIQWSWVVGIVLTVMLSIGGMQLWQFIDDPKRMPIDVIVVDGELQHVSQARLQEKVMQAVEGSFFSVNVNKVKKAARFVPWVADVQVRKIWPDTLSLTVEEHKAYAKFNNSQLINAQGKSFSPDKSSFPKQLANLVGKEADLSRLWATYVNMQSQLTPHKKRIVRIELNERGAWNFSLADGVEVQLGSNDVDQRFKRFIKIYPQLSAQVNRQAAQLDMRYSNGLAVKWSVPEMITGELNDKRGDS